MQDARLVVVVCLQQAEGPLVLEAQDADDTHHQFGGLHLVKGYGLDVADLSIRSVRLTQVLAFFIRL